jgi:hypothetical protein
MMVGLIAAVLQNSEVDTVFSVWLEWDMIPHMSRSEQGQLIL